MSPYRVRKLVLGLSPKLSTSCNSGRVNTNTTRLCQNPLVVVAREGSRCAKMVGAAVLVEDFTLERRPLELQRKSV